MSEMITWRDVRDAGFCLNHGARRWCAQHGVSFRDLMREGVPVADVAHIDDEFVRRVIEVANGR